LTGDGQTVPHKRALQDDFWAAPLLAKEAFVSDGAAHLGVGSSAEMGA